MQTKRELNIIIIDDDRDDFELVNEAIQEIDPNIKVYFIDRCEDAFLYRDMKIDLVLLDINMPYHNGFSWLRSIRENGYTDLPVIMYTNSISPANIEKAYEEGANLYFNKPESFNNLIAGLSKLINIDWSKPHSVKEQYRNDSNYKLFQFA